MRPEVDSEYLMDRKPDAVTLKRYSCVYNSGSRKCEDNFFWKCFAKYDVNRVDIVYSTIENQDANGHHWSWGIGSVWPHYSAMFQDSSEVAGPGKYFLVKDTYQEVGRLAFLEYRVKVLDPL